MSKLDTKQKVLVAFYTEYQKDVPNMRSITAESLGIEEEVYIIALQKLDNEGLISDVNFFDAMGSLRPVAVGLDYAMMTPDGLEYVETKLGIEPTLSGSEKAKEAIKKLGEWGLEQTKDVISKIASDIITGKF